MRYFGVTMREKGFTLVELITVIAIIGILSSVVVANLNGVRAKGRDSRRVADIASLQLALESYRDICRQYPATLAIDACNGCGGCPVGGTGGTVNFGSFIGAIPTAPSGGSYSYAPYSSNSQYVIKATLEQGNKVLEDDVDGDDVGGTGVDCGANPEVSPNWFYCKGN